MHPSARHFSAHASARLGTVTWQVHMVHAGKASTGSSLPTLRWGPSTPLGCRLVALRMTGYKSDGCDGRMVGRYALRGAAKAPHACGQGVRFVTAFPPTAHRPLANAPICTPFLSSRVSAAWDGYVASTHGPCWKSLYRFISAYAAMGSFDSARLSPRCAQDDRVW